MSALEEVTWQLDDLLDEGTTTDPEAAVGELLDRAGRLSGSFADDYEGGVADLDGPGLIEAMNRLAEISDLVGRALNYGSFQFSYQTMPNYHSDSIGGGETRREGPTDFAQLRIVAPLPYENFTILPRLTLRHYENAQGESGIGNTELFGLIIPKSWDWGTGRVGVGPLITAPGDTAVAKDQWGYGFAAAVVNAQGRWFYGLLFTQSWRGIDPNQLPAGTSDTNPLGIAPFLNRRSTNGYSWRTSSISLYLTLMISSRLLYSMNSRTPLDGRK